MSTRCHIIVEHLEHRVRVILYRHCDGYPYGEGGVLATLAPLVARFMQHRGWDPCYLAAHIMADQINQSRAARRKHIEDSGLGDPLHHALRVGFGHAALESPAEERTAKAKALAEVENDFLGYGISNEVHGDVEYIYYVRQDGIHVHTVIGVGACGVASRAMTTPEEAKALMTGEIPERFKDWPEEEDEED